MPYVPPIVIDTPDLIGQQIQLEQQRQQQRVQLDQLSQRREDRLNANSQSLINRSLSQSEKGKLGRLTQPSYLQKGQELYYAWQDAGTNYYENPSPQNKASLDEATNSYRQGVGTLLIYDQEEKDYLTKMYSSPGDFRTTPNEFNSVAGERRSLIATLPNGAPVPVGLSLAEYVVINDDIKPFSFVDESYKLANRVQSLIDAEPNKYAPGGQINVSLLEPFINEQASFTIGEQGEIANITIASINKDLESPSSSEYRRRLDANPDFGPRQKQAALNKLVEMTRSQVTPPKPKEMTDAQKEQSFPKKYANLGEVPVELDGAKGVQQVFSGNRVIKVALPGQSPKNIVGRAVVNGKTYVSTIPTSQLEAWEEGYTGSVQPTLEPATAADKEAMRQNMLGHYSTGAFKTSATPPKKGVSSQGKKDPLGIL